MSTMTSRKPSDDERISISLRHGCLWIVLPDSINMDNCDQIEERLRATLTEAPEKTVIDLSRTKNMFSAGFGMIVRFKKDLEKLGKRIFLVNVPPQVREALTSLGLHKVLPVYTDGAPLDFIADT